MKSVKSELRAHRHSQRGPRLVCRYPGVAASDAIMMRYEPRRKPSRVPARCTCVIDELNWTVEKVGDERGRIICRRSVLSTHQCRESELRISTKARNPNLGFSLPGACSSELTQSEWASRRVGLARLLARRGGQVYSACRRCIFDRVDSALALLSHLSTKTTISLLSTPSFPFPRILSLLSVCLCDEKKKEIQIQIQNETRQREKGRWQRRPHPHRRICVSRRLCHRRRPCCRACRVNSSSTQGEEEFRRRNNSNNKHFERIPTPPPPPIWQRRRRRCATMRAVPAHNSSSSGGVSIIIHITSRRRRRWISNTSTTYTWWSRA